MAPRDDEAHDRPDRPAIDAGQELRVLEAFEALTFGEADPADRTSVEVRNEPGRRAVAGEGLKSSAVGARVRVRPVQPTNAEELAPAPLGVAALFEQRREVAEP